MPSSRANAGAAVLAIAISAGPSESLDLVRRRNVAAIYAVARDSAPPLDLDAGVFRYVMRDGRLMVRPVDAVTPHWCQYENRSLRRRVDED